MQTPDYGYDMPSEMQLHLADAGIGYLEDLLSNYGRVLNLADRFECEPVEIQTEIEHLIQQYYETEAEMVEGVLDGDI